MVFHFSTFLQEESNSVISSEASGSWFTHQHLNKFHKFIAMYILYLPACASEQGNVIGLVSVYIYVIKKNCN